MWAVYGGDVRGEVGTRSRMCYVGWAVWVHGGSAIAGGILFKMLVLGINEMIFNLSSEVLKGYSLFLIYKTNIFFFKLLKLNLMPM